MRVGKNSRVGLLVQLIEAEVRAKVAEKRNEKLEAILDLARRVPVHCTCVWSCAPEREMPELLTICSGCRLERALEDFDD